MEKMRYLRIFESFQSESEVAKICAKYGIRNWSINSEGLVDVDGDVDLSYELYNSGIKKIPLNFGKVTGNFICKNNELTSLEGSPREVGGDFNCNSWKLLSLEGIGSVGGEIIIRTWSAPCSPIYLPWVNWSHSNFNKAFNKSESELVTFPVYKIIIKYSDKEL
jgi:hypothetical protein